jgi:hypothetical protein
MNDRKQTLFYTLTNIFILHDKHNNDCFGGYLIVEIIFLSDLDNEDCIKQIIAYDVKKYKTLRILFICK